LHPTSPFMRLRMSHDTASHKKFAMHERALTQ